MGDFKGVAVFGSVRSGKIISFTFIWHVSVFNNFIISFASQNNSVRISTYYYYSHIIEKETQTKVCDLPKFTHVISSRAKSQNQVFRFQVFISPGMPIFRKLSPLYFPRKKERLLKKQRISHMSFGEIPVGRTIG